MSQIEYVYFLLNCGHPKQWNNPPTSLTQNDSTRTSAAAAQKRNMKNDLARVTCQKYGSVPFTTFAVLIHVYMYI